MTIEVHVSRQPAVPYRAFLLTLLFLIVASLLAWGMSARRTATVLGQVIRLPGWGVSFQPPRGFLPGNTVTSSLGEVLPFHRRLPDGVAVEIAYWRMPNPSSRDPVELCKTHVRILKLGVPLSMMRLIGPPSSPPMEAALGTLAAVEIVEPASALAVRLGLAADGAAYAVSLRVEGGPIEQSVYELFHRACEAITVENTSGSIR